MDSAVRRRVDRLLDRAARKIDGAASALSSGFAEDSVSRAYYAMYHAGMALLATEGERPRTHRGFSIRLYERFVRSGRLDPSHHAALARARELREYGDYDEGWTADEATARTVLAEARSFLEAARKILDSGPPTTT